MSRPTRDYADRHPRNNGGGRRRPAAGGASRKPPSRGGGGKTGLPAWAWTVVGLSAGLVVAAVVYIGRPAQPMDLAPSTAAKIKPKAIELPPKEPSRFAFYEMLPSYEVVVSDEVLNAPPPPKPKPAVAAALPTAAADPIAAFAETPAAEALPTPRSPGPQATAAERVAALQAAVAEEDQKRTATIAAKAIASGKSPATIPKPPAAAPAPAAASPDASVGGERYLIQVAAFRKRGDADQQRAALSLLGLSGKVEQVTIDNRDTWYRVRVGPYATAAAAEAAQRTLQSQGLKGVVMKIKS